MARTAELDKSRDTKLTALVRDVELVVMRAQSTTALTLANDLVHDIEELSLGSLRPNRRNNIETELTVGRWLAASRQLGVPSADIVTLDTLNLAPAGGTRHSQEVRSRQFDKLAVAVEEPDRLQVGERIEQGGFWDEQGKVVVHGTVALEQLRDTLKRDSEPNVVVVIVVIVVRVVVYTCIEVERVCMRLEQGIHEGWVLVRTRVGDF